MCDIIDEYKIIHKCVYTGRGLKARIISLLGVINCYYSYCKYNNVGRINTISSIPDYYLIKIITNSISKDELRQVSYYCNQPIIHFYYHVIDSVEAGNIEIHTKNIPPFFFQWKFKKSDLLTLINREIRRLESHYIK